MLRDGGNAIDAAVAVGFALAVVHPVAGNLGGGGFLVYRSADGADTRALDFQRDRSGGGPPRHVPRRGGRAHRGQPDRPSLGGHPGLGGRPVGDAPGPWLQAPGVSWSSRPSPSAESHVVDADRSYRIERAREGLLRFEASEALFFVDGEPLPEGHEWRNPDLAASLERIAEDGRDGFYAGETADLLVAEMERGGGLITHEDLAEYEVVWRDAVEVSYRGRTILTMPPVSSGGVTMGLMMHVLEGFALEGANTPSTIQLQTEAMRQAFIDRNRYLGDPAFIDMPLDRLMSAEYADVVRARIEPGVAGTTPPFDPGPREPMDTTHYSIVDADGAAVSITTTINLGFGSKVTVAGAGFLLNDEMDDFAAKPGTPNAYGLVQGEANAVAPGKRMLSSMTPSIVVGEARSGRDGRRGPRGLAHHHLGLPRHPERARFRDAPRPSRCRAADAPSGPARQDHLRAPRPRHRHRGGARSHGLRARGENRLRWLGCRHPSRGRRPRRRVRSQKSGKRFRGVKPVDPF